MAMVTVDNIHLAIFRVMPNADRISKIFVPLAALQKVCHAGGIGIQFVLEALRIKRQIFGLISLYVTF